MLILGFLLIAGALGALALAVLEPGKNKISASRRRPVDEVETSAIDSLVHRAAGMVDGAVRRGRWTPFTALELEMAGWKTSVGFVIVAVSAASVFAFGLVWAATGTVAAGLVLAALIPIATKVLIAQRSTARRRAFSDQLDSTLQMLASALRAGHSLARALDTTSRDAASPTAEELGRIINESRIGRDIVDAMHTTADRMQSEDFHWVAEAVSVQRDTGGNLNEVLDRVGHTIRERASLLREVHSLSAEGRMSAIVLMVMPVFVSLVMMITSPTYMAPLLNTSVGLIVLGVSAGLFAIGGLWMRSIIKVKI